MECVVDLSNIEWVRDGKHVLKDINWQIKKGENWALIGLNGSGKTSLLNMISGYLFPSKGEVRILGNKLGECDVRELRQSIGTVSASLQEKLHYADPSVEIVMTGKYAALTFYEKKLDKDKIDAYNLLKEMELSYLADKPYGLLSQGEKQKVLVARALMANPQLFVLDEPCAGMDIFARERFLENLNLLSKQPHMPTVIYVTHHIEEIMPMITHVMLIREGEMIAKGKKKEVLTNSLLEKVLNVPVHIEWKQERPWIQVVK